MLLLLLAGYGTYVAPAFAINADEVMVKVDDLGMYVDDANLGWSVSQGSVRMNVERGG